MKLFGLILGAVAVLVAVFLAVFPVSVTVLGSRASCGVPVDVSFRSIDSVSTLVDESSAPSWEASSQAQTLQAAERECRTSARQHLFAGVAIGGTGLAIAIPAFVVGLRDERRRRAEASAAWRWGPPGPPWGPPPAV